MAVDGAAENWKAWGNNVWPSVYLIDRRGNVRRWWYGELNWQGARGEESMRKRIEELLVEEIDVRAAAMATAPAHSLVAGLPARECSCRCSGPSAAVCAARRNRHRS